MTDIERRFTAFPVEARRADGDAGRRIGGYAAVFNRLSQNLGGWVEQISPTAFNKSRGDGWPDVVARFDHENAFLLGTTVGQTLRLGVDGTGLLYEVDVPAARADVYELVERGDVRKSSFAFRVYPDGDEWGVSDQGFPLRTILSAQLVDVAPVVSPAYTDTTAALRRLAERVDTELEEVRAAAQANELRRFVAAKGDPEPGPKPKPRLFGPSARALLDARRDDLAA
jgi:HK97 family phage prohead protease